MNSFSAEGDVSVTTLTVTSDVVNTNINIQNLDDEYIDITEDEVFSRPLG